MDCSKLREEILSTSIDTHVYKEEKEDHGKLLLISEIAGLGSAVLLEVSLSLSRSFHGVRFESFRQPVLGCVTTDLSEQSLI